MDVRDNTPGGVAVYSCNSGFSLAGNDSRVCGQDGEWEGEPPVCEGLQLEFRAIISIASSCVGNIVGPIQEITVVRGREKDVHERGICPLLHCTCRFLGISMLYNRDLHAH